MIKFIYVMISHKACKYIAFEVSARKLQIIFAVFIWQVNFIVKKKKKVCTS